MIIDPKNKESISEFKPVIPRHRIIIYARITEFILGFSLFLSLMIIFIIEKVAFEQYTPYVILLGLIIIMIIRRLIINHFKGVTLGLLIFGVRYVDISTRKYLSKDTYHTLWWHQTLHSFKLSGWGEFSEFIDNPYAQSKVMKDMGIIYVNKKLFESK